MGAREPRGDDGDGGEPGGYTATTAAMEAARASVRARPRVWVRVVRPTKAALHPRVLVELGMPGMDRMMGTH